MAVLPEVDMMLSKVKIDDIQVGNPGSHLPKNKSNYVS